VIHSVNRAISSPNDRFLARIIQDRTVPTGDVEIFFKSDSLRDVTCEVILAGATGAMDAFVRGGYARALKPDTVPLPTVYDSVASLTAVSEFKAAMDHRGRLVGRRGDLEAGSMA
jgi:hypothetical protein